MNFATDDGSLHLGMTYKDYERLPGMRFSTAKKGLSSMKSLKSAIDGGTNERSKEMVIGEACHTCLLQPELFEKRYLRGPDERRNSKAWKEAEEKALGYDKILLKPGEFDEVLEITRSVLVEPASRDLFKDTQVEVSIAWTDITSGLKLKARIDCFSRDRIIDFKTSSCAAPHAFQRRLVSDYHYALQAAYYQRAWHSVTSTIVPFTFVVAEKSPGYPIAVYDIHEADMEVAQMGLNDLLADIATSMTMDDWPGYGRRMLELPEWYIQKQEAKL